MKAVTTVLVLLAGAAVVLWYGNTLNSWVLGGLIGGFAALLLSIPISLVLFSYFSRHRDELQQEELPEYKKMALAQYGSYSGFQDQLAYNEEYVDYEDEDLCAEYDEDVNRYGYRLAEQTVWEEEPPRRVPPARHLPSPSSTRSLVVSQDLSSQLQPDFYETLPQHQPIRRRRGGHRPVNYPGYQTDLSHSRYRGEALRAARVEAALQAKYDPLNEEVAQHVEQPIIRRSLRYLNPPSADAH